MRIANGRSNGDSHGEFTCFTPRGCSVIDYLIVSAELLPNILNLHIGTLPVFSDHCPLVFNFAINMMSTVLVVEEEPSTCNRTLTRLKWDDEIKDTFKNRLQENSTKEEVSHMRRNLKSESQDESARKLTRF